MLNHVGGKVRKEENMVVGKKVMKKKGRQKSGKKYRGNPDNSDPLGDRVNSPEDTKKFGKLSILGVLNSF